MIALLVIALVLTWALGLRSAFQQLRPEGRLERVCTVLWPATYLAAFVWAVSQDVQLAWKNRRPVRRPSRPMPVMPDACAHGVTLCDVRGGDLDDSVALGVRHVRVVYSALHPLQPNSFWPWLFEALDARGLEPLVVIKHFDSLEQAVSQLAQLTTAYPGRTWEVGCRLDDVRDGRLHLTGGQYAVLMQRLVAACPAGTRFAGMVLASAELDPVAYRAFLQHYIAAGGPTLAAWCLQGFDVQGLRGQVAIMREVLGDRYPLWLTEYGISQYMQERLAGERTPEQLDEGQRAFIAQMTANAGVLGISRTYYHCFHDNSDRNFGLVRSDFTRRPAWYALQAVQEARV